MTRGVLRHQDTIISLDWEGRGLAEWGGADGEARDMHQKGSYPIRTFLVTTAHTAYIMTCRGSI
jgi:hypothetical protein